MPHVFSHANAYAVQAIVLRNSPISLHLTPELHEVTRSFGHLAHSLRRSSTSFCVFSMSKLRISVEFLRFLQMRRKYWLTPIVVVLLLLSLLIVLTQGSALAPFIYSLF